MTDRDRLLAAIELSRQCPPSATAFAVGAVIVDFDGRELAWGYSRETDPHVHAEESALGKLAATRADLTRATIYSSLEPCGARKSRVRTCAELILAAGLPRVVFAMREPPVFVEGYGVELLGRAGVEVVELADLAHLVGEINAHVLTGRSGG